MQFSKINYTQKQSGSVLLAIMLVLVVSASFVLVSKLNASSNEYTRQSANLSVLNEAKAALIGYAINYPENYSGEGPGFLPCPDSNNDGTADGACSLGGPTNFTIGRLPHTTVGIDKLKDTYGDVLWYAVADNYRNNPKVAQLNSDVDGDFTVDTIADVVAVIFAPGAPLSGQVRGTNAEKVTITNYLEDDNADLDAVFVSHPASDFTSQPAVITRNDTVVYITRQELMQAVEKRVLGEVSQTLTNYQNAYTAFPWLSSFANPDLSSFRGLSGNLRGHIPFHWALDPDSVEVGTGLNISNRNPFTTDYDISWSSISNATLVPNSATQGWFTLQAPTQACVENSQCSNAADPFNGIVSSSQQIINASCVWGTKSSFGCPPAAFSQSKTHTVWSNANVYGYKNGTSTGWVQFWTNTSGSYKWNWASFNNSGSFGWGWHSINRVVQGNLTRTYAFDISFIDPDGIQVTNPTLTSERTRDLNITGDISSATVTLSVTDNFVESIQYPDYNIGNLQSSNVLTSDVNTTGTISASNIYYDIDVDDGELPEWFVANGWHELIYVSYASGENLPGSTICTSGTNCISVDADGVVTNNNVRAVAVSAGADLSPLSTRPNGTLTDYFEAENSIVDDLFMKDRVTTNKNDQTRIIAIAP